MIRTGLAIVVGIFITAALGQLGAIVFLLVTVGIPLGAEATEPSAVGYVALLFMAALAAGVGGGVTRRIARGHARVAVVSLVALLALVAFWGFRQPSSQWPAWWPAAVAISVAVGACLGGLRPAQRPRI